MNFQEYPKWLNHPGYRPAVISDDYGSGPRPVNAPPGRPAQLPPVMVHNPDQEAYYRAQGYEGASGGAKAFEAATVAPLPPGYRHQEYPRYQNGVVEPDPDAPAPPDNEYPKWVYPEGRAPLIVKNAAQEAEIMRGSERHEPLKRADPSAVETECIAAIMAAAGEREAPPDARAALCARAAELGLRIDRRWGEKKLRHAIERATREEAA